MPQGETLTFTSAADFRRWLEENHAATDHIWIRFLKKRPGVEALTYLQALDEALCFGWIDGQLKPLDEVAWLQRWGRRRAKSKWSQRNVKFAERLLAAGRIAPAGLREIEAAKADGRWQEAYPSPRDAEAPEDFLRALKKNKKAHAFFQTLTRTNRYSIVYRLHHAKKPETRERWMKTILAMLEEGKTFHPQASSSGRRKSAEN
jgi:uncharacterized protein YdeI (YjbR/CyaY-like superfamily)